MNIHNVQQGSPEWLKIRKGKATASEFAKILTPTGNLSSQADAYARKLARECLFDEPEELQLHPTKSIKWGHAHEDAASEAFMLETGHDVCKVGFVTNETHPCLGCSPDRLIGDDRIIVSGKEFAAGLEIKCVGPDRHVEWLMEKDRNPAFFPAEYLPQVHGSMVVTGLRKWEFCGYFPPDADGYGPPLVLATATWNGYTDKLQAALFEFAERYRIIAADVWRVLGKEGM